MESEIANPHILESDRSILRTYICYGIYQIPDDSVEQWSFTPMLHQGLDGERQWQIGFDGKNLVIEYGKVNGLLQVDVVPVTMNTRSTSVKDQGYKEAKSRYQAKYKSGYRPFGTSSLVRKIEPMKSESYIRPGTETGKQKPSKLDWPVAEQWKLDGIRILTTDEDGLVMRTTKNTVYTHLEHLHEPLQTFFCYLPADATLDGELFNKDMSFNQLVSAVKSIETCSPNRFLIQYWLFDLITPERLPYERRYTILTEAYNSFLDDYQADPCIRIVPTDIAHSYEEIDMFYNSYLADGYEGAMIKCLAMDAAEGSTRFNRSLYRSGARTKHVLKYKPFIDEEVEVIKLKPGLHGVALIIVKNVQGTVFSTNVSGVTLEERKSWLKNPSLIVGKQVTVRYQELTEKGVPRFPRIVAIRDYE